MTEATDAELWGSSCPIVQRDPVSDVPTQISVLFYKTRNRGCHELEAVCLRDKRDRSPKPTRYEWGDERRMMLQKRTKRTRH
jgi:hypothetical protein